MYIDIYINIHYILILNVSNKYYKCIRIYVYIVSIFLYLCAMLILCESSIKKDIEISDKSMFLISKDLSLHIKKRGWSLKLRTKRVRVFHT